MKIGDGSANGAVYIGDTANGDMTNGLTINQGAAANHILTFKADGVTHAMTDQVETDTFGLIRQYGGGDAGGMEMFGFKGDGSYNTGALTLSGALGEAGDTTKSTSGAGIVRLTSHVKSSNTYGAAGADQNLLTIMNHTTTRFIFDAEGSGHADVEWTTFSDERLKSNIRDLPYGLDTVMALRARIFDRQSGYISDGVDEHKSGDVILEDKKRVQIGLIAQEAEDLIPELVKTPPDEYSFYSMDYERLSVVNLSAIQELNEKVVALEAQVAALQN